MGDPIGEYVGHLNRLFNQTLTDSQLVRTDEAGSPAGAVIARRQGGLFIPLELSPGWLQFDQKLRVTTGNRVSVVRSTYIYIEGADWTAGDWQFRYEYDRPPKEGRPHSHLHLNAKHSATEVDLSDKHFPVGRMSVEHVIWLLAKEYGVRCKCDADCLRSLLDKSYRKWVIEKRTDLHDPLFP